MTIGISVQGCLNHSRWPHLRDLSSGRTSGSYNFLPTGPIVAGWNPMQQFVGSYDYTITPGNGGLNLTLSNYTSVNSGSYHQMDSHERSSLRSMGTVHQTY